MSSRLRYSEAFYSVQGEGKFVGVPSVFLRTFGCNFRCMNFGIDRYPNRAEKLKQGIKYNPEVKQLLDDGVLDKVETFEELPPLSPPAAKAKLFMKKKLIMIIKIFFIIKY